RSSFVTRHTAVRCALTPLLGAHSLSLSTCSTPATPTKASTMLSLRTLVCHGKVRRAAAVLGWRSMASRGHGPCLTYTPACGAESCSDVPTYAESMSLMALMATTAAALGGLAQCQEEHKDDDDDDVEIENWSSTHSVKTKAYLQPESAYEVERIISEAHNSGKRIRVVGNALSPNGLGLSEDAMLSLGQCDRVLHVDKKKGTVTVEAGARVQQVVDALAPHGLTLQNYASISEQQLGGFLQVGAHGTGATIPPVDEQVVGMKLVTPKLGTLELSNEKNPSLFRMAKVGLGAFGVVTEVTIKCVERHQLVESTAVMTRAEVKANHDALLRSNKHIRYMWIPYTDAVVVVRCNPVDLHGKSTIRPVQMDKALHRGARDDNTVDMTPANNERDKRDCLQPLESLLLEKVGSTLSPAALKDISSLDFAGLRDHLLAVAPLDVSWIKQVNNAEAEFWRRSQGTRVDYSDKILGFECGGQQWVNEVSFPVGTLEEPNGKDLDYMDELMRLIEREGIPAPAPIEQRWTSSSNANMSPAHDRASSETVFSWVGVIMYLPADDVDARKRVTEAFFAYRDLCKVRLWERYDCAVHWAKIEKPRTAREAEDTRARLRQRCATNLPCCFQFFGRGLVSVEKQGRLESARRQ
ncbi:unnamed protein product, partial [Ectocarpus sp. 8 AP-2014]